MPCKTLTVWDSHADSHKPMTIRRPWTQDYIFDDIKPFQSTFDSCQISICISNRRARVCPARAGDLSLAIVRNVKEALDSTLKHLFWRRLNCQITGSPTLPIRRHLLLMQATYSGLGATLHLASHHYPGRKTSPKTTLARVSLNCWHRNPPYHIYWLWLLDLTHNTLTGS